MPFLLLGSAYFLWVASHTNWPKICNFLVGKEARPNSKLTVRWWCLFIMLFLLGYFLITIIILQFFIILHILSKKYREREEVSGIIESTDSDSLFQYCDVSLWGYFMKWLKRKQDSLKSCFPREEPMPVTE